MPANRSTRRRLDVSAAVQAILEPLEDRQMLSAWIEQRVLEVRGTPADDIIAIWAAPRARITVDVNGERQVFPRSAVRAIRVLGGRGNDRIHIATKVAARQAVKLLINSGPGDDVLTGLAATVSTAANPCPDTPSANTPPSAQPETPPDNPPPPVSSDEQTATQSPTDGADATPAAPPAGDTAPTAPPEYLPPPDPVVSPEPPQTSAPEPPPGTGAEQNPVGDGDVMPVTIDDVEDIVLVYDDGTGDATSDDPPPPSPQPPPDEDTGSVAPENDAPSANDPPPSDGNAGDSCQNGDGPQEPTAPPASPPPASGEDSENTTADPGSPPPASEPPDPVIEQPPVSPPPEDTPTADDASSAGDIPAAPQDPPPAQDEPASGGGSVAAVLLDNQPPANTGPQTPQTPPDLAVDPPPTPETPSAEQPAFMVWDALGFANKPNLAAFGMSAVYLTDREFLASSGSYYDDTKPNETRTRALARKVANLNVPLILDIENWCIDIRKAPLNEVQANLAKFMRLIDWLRNERPGLKIGFYGLLPQGDYWTPYMYLTAQERMNEPWWAGNYPRFRQAYLDWQAANDFLRPLAERVDFLCPSLYTYYDDRDGWRKFALASIQEAKRYGKPVLPFVWPEYHDSNPTLRYTALPVDYWSMQLSFLRQHADGVVMWGGWDLKNNRQLTWNESAPWWTAAKGFLNSLAA